jgi:5-methyltetrahydropteroyltriglutamate--homocysteine methyltransferase
MGIASMTQAANLGFPRIGQKRRLKTALEDHWAGRLSEVDLLAAARSLRRDHLLLQQGLGLDVVPVNDFSLYDHVLDTAALVGAVPSRFGGSADTVDLATYFAMARGSSRDRGAMEMTKWFDTNYHYIVPELDPAQTFVLRSFKPVEELREARALGVPARPVLLGPVSFLRLGKPAGAAVRPEALLAGLLAVYEDVLRRLAKVGAEWVQIDEPCLALDQPPEAGAMYAAAYERLSRAAPGLLILVATYFEGLRDNLPIALRLPVAALHLDLVRAPDQLDRALASAPRSLTLSLGVVDGRNIWRTDLDRAVGMAERAAEALGSERVQVAPSCSLLHVPLDADLETDVDPEVREWLAFAKQKIQEVVVVARAVREGRRAVAAELDAQRETLRRREASPALRREQVRSRLRSITPELLRRVRPFPERRSLQRASLALPPLPSTTIGSFPQTSEVRAARAARREGRMPEAEYERFLRAAIETTIREQETIGLDVLVHGEFERNDMVEYFGEQLSGFAFTRHGWVQSYGSRCVKPPILFGDVARPAPMTVSWSRYAQSLTPRPVKGMLTGPSTILQWSFVRDDQPRGETRRQIALAIRDEVADLEAAGLKVIQIDEPGLREGLPLRAADAPAYLEEAVLAFRLAACVAGDATQIHTHMCYAELNDIMDAVASLDADVISIESSRSRMELLEVFRERRYPNEIGPGVYDIHSPRIPTEEEIAELLRRALAVLSPEQLWVNPDCGLKTRRWEEVRPALAAMVAAARSLRREIGAPGG